MGPHQMGCVKGAAVAQWVYVHDIVLPPKGPLTETDEDWEQVRRLHTCSLARREGDTDTGGGEGKHTGNTES